MDLDLGPEGLWCRLRRNGLGDESDIGVRKNEASRVTSGSLVCTCGRRGVPFIETGNTGRGSGLTVKTTQLILDIT